MKAILISIKPKYVADILNGNKTLEIRKTMPKCDLPIEVYIYCTRDKVGLYDNHNHITSASDKYFLDRLGYDKPPLLNGKVVTKFTLNKVQPIYQIPLNKLLKDSCLNAKELNEYTNGVGHDLIYAWHIDNLVIFDKPKELSEFKSYKKNIVNTKINGMVFETELDNSLIKAPQSWCYVEI